MTPTPIDIEYFEWLVSQIHIPNDKTYNDLFERMHNVPFHWTVPNDDNRVQDALDLRLHFLDGSRQRLNLHREATFLEILVSLSQKLAFIGGGAPERCAWKLIKNLRLNTMSDPLTEAMMLRVNDILFTVIWRTYRPDGQGGFFPLKNPKEDQTKVEIWYQMNQYIIERGLI